MIRKQFFIDEAQNRKLKALAAASGRSEGQIIREGLDALLAVQAKDTDWKARVRKVLASLEPGDFEGLDDRIKANRNRMNKAFWKRVDAAKRVKSGETVK